MLRYSACKNVVWELFAEMIDLFDFEGVYDSFIVHTERNDILIWLLLRGWRGLFLGFGRCYVCLLLLVMFKYLCITKFGVHNHTCSMD